MMALVILVGLIWLIVLQVSVNRLQDKLDRLLSGQSVPSPQSDTAEPQAAPAPAEPAQEPEILPQPVVEATAPQPEPIDVTPEPALPAKTSKPGFEITAAKLFSWLGGFMLFLGCIFGIKYAVEKHFLLLSPAMRIMVSCVLGLGLAAVGFWMKNDKYRITSHTLLGSGLAITYAAVFCAHAFYHLISLPLAFVSMGIISFVALMASLQKESKYVGYLGAVIAFLTPVLLNSGQDAWVAFFLYVFCINAASAYAAVKKGWYGLFICTLSFTWLSQAVWLFPVQPYKLTGVAAFFSLYALSSAWLVRKQPAPSKLAYASATFLCMSLLLMIPAGACLQDAVTSQYVNFLATGLPENPHFPGTLAVCLQFLGYVLLTNALVLLLAGRKLVPYWFTRVGKVLSFLVLVVWIEQTLAPLWLTLTTCLVFTVLNSALELLPRFSRDTQPDAFSAVYPVAMMGSIWILSLLPGRATAVTDFACFLGSLGLLIALTLIIAVYARLLWMGIIAAVLLFGFLMGQLILGIGGTGFSPFILVSGLLPICLCSAVLGWLRRTHKLEAVTGIEKAISAVTALMPFLLILTAFAKVPLSHVVFIWILSITGLVCVVNMVAARFYNTTYTLPVAVVGSALVQMTILVEILTHKNLFHPFIFPLGLVAILGLFVLTPFVSRERFWNKNGTWIACALAGLSACLWGSMWIHEYVACLPASLVAILLLVIYAALLYRLWGSTKTPQGRPVSIGFMSGTVLILLTAIFPLEIHNHWLAAAWALEAVFLSGLYKKLPYRGWQVAIVGLLSIVALMLLGLTTNTMPSGRIWNWYLWVYGLCAASFFACAKLWDKPAVFKPVFYTACGVTLFWLLNLEITHWFSIGHYKYLDFAFTGQVAQALAYTLGWALFGLGTIGLGLKLQKSALSKTGIGVVGLALVKFFLSDIWQLEAIYRIIGLFGLAVMLIIASFWYQRKKTVH